MANVSLVLCVILLAGTVKTSLGACTISDMTKCQASSENCRAVRDCLQSVAADCDNEQIRTAINQALKALPSECGNGNGGGNGDGNTATGQVSSLFICLGLANLAYFLTKFR